MRAAAVAGLGLLGCGCLSTGAYLGARPTPRGQVDLGVAAAPLLYERGREPAVAPSAEITLRGGVTDDTDVGVRLFGAGAEVGARHRFAHAPGFDAALLPSVLLAWTPYTNNTVEVVHARARLGLVADLHPHPALTLTLGPHATLGAAGPYTALHQLGDGLTPLATLGGVAGLAWAPGWAPLELRAEAGLERPFVLGGSPRSLTGHGGLHLRWRIP